MVKLNHSVLDVPVCDINTLMYYLETTLEHASKLIGVFMDFREDINGDSASDNSLNLEALDELMFATKKISSKADALQNKVANLKKIVNA